MNVEVGHQPQNELAELFVAFAIIGGAGQRINTLEPTVRDEATACAQHFWVLRRNHILGAEEHLFVELFPGADAGELDVDVAPDSQRRQAPPSAAKRVESSAILACLVRFLVERGTSVTLVLSPYHPVVFEKMKSDPLYAQVPKAEAVVKAIAAE